MELSHFMVLFYDFQQICKFWIFFVNLYRIYNNSYYDGINKIVHLIKYICSHKTSSFLHFISLSLYQHLKNDLKKNEAQIKKVPNINQGKINKATI